MLTLEQQEVFWSDLYRGRPIAIYNRDGRWHVYLDHVLQHNKVFATGEHAVRWLRQRIDTHCVSAPAVLETALAA
jgi:hypothetical protein